MTRVKPGQRKRAKAPKVRTGCQTCNPRRTGTSTGRKCDGYASQAAPSPEMPLSAYPTPPSQDELRAVQSRTLAQVSKFFVDKLWTTKILRIAHTEPGIWYALISLSSYHKLFMQPVDAANNQLAMERHNLDIYALHHHNMAIKAALDIQGTPKHPLSYIISCVVFVTIEIIRGEIIAAIRLLKHGQRVLQEFEMQQRQSLIPLGSEDGVIVNLVEAFFTCLTHQAVCVGHLTGVTIY
ncbi:C6 zinc finger domain protein [Metarhizium guizhouense ARSEF 977]|uniref:C6 zinc finger domain protein n=1 Tax=Metarhizium guizhouense (strain ARSEF 977) TaxID=1276136 RepID=A0A0B4GFC1_METGA|nr:C6 zinc finger domain protein [Metarhizium guizhouense ARSEF 977]